MSWITKEALHGKPYHRFQYNIARNLLLLFLSDREVMCNVFDTHIYTFDEILELIFFSF